MTGPRVVVDVDAELGREESLAAGKAARRGSPLESHAEFVPGPKRDPIGLLLGQNAARVPDLVPVRHGRMLVSPFTFYRGAALPMAADLAGTPTSGLWVQLCGDAHLCNFGAFGSPERRLVFDVNDFDETLPGPFEWDVKRLAASMSVAGRANGFGTKQRRSVVLDTAIAYRTSMRWFATASMLDVWYARFDVVEALKMFKSQLSKKSVRSTKSQIAKALTQDSMKAVAKLTRVVHGRREIISAPPLIVPVEELSVGVDVDALYDALRGLVALYASSLPDDRRGLLGRYRLSRLARKVVGVGSVGTESWILLMEPRDGREPLFLQAKQAGPSVLAGYLRPSAYDNQGERVVAGQRLMQAASDVFLGWQRSTLPGRPTEDYYLRQLRDWKFSVDVTGMDPSALSLYGQMCGWTLARAHARSGDRIAIAAYLGKTDTFDRAMLAFAESYADQTERDHAAFRDAVASGRVDARTGL